MLRETTERLRDELKHEAELREKIDDDQTKRMRQFEVDAAQEISNEEKKRMEAVVPIVQVLDEDCVKHRADLSRLKTQRVEVLTTAQNEIMDEFAALEGEILKEQKQ